MLISQSLSPSQTPLERWLRRLPKLAVAQHELSAGHFLYTETDASVALIPDRKSELSLWEAWQLEDALIRIRRTGLQGTENHGTGSG